MTEYKDASPEDFEAYRLIVGALEGFMEIAGRKTAEWIAAGREAGGPEWWYMMLILHATEALRIQSGGALRSVDFKTLAMIIDEAARGTPLFVRNPRATHTGTGTLQ